MRRLFRKVSEDEQLQLKISRWEKARARGLAIRVAVRSTDLTVDLLGMEEQAAWDLLIERALGLAPGAPKGQDMPVHPGFPRFPLGFLAPREQQSH